MADVKVAEDAMMKAQKALQTYSDSGKEDFDEEGRLIGEVRKAVESYLATVSALGT